MLYFCMGNVYSSNLSEKSKQKQNNDKVKSDKNVNIGHFNLSFSLELKKTPC